MGWSLFVFLPPESVSVLARCLPAWLARHRVHLAAASPEEEAAQERESRGRDDGRRAERGRGDQGKPIAEEPEREGPGERAPRRPTTESAVAVERWP